MNLTENMLMEKSFTLSDKDVDSYELILFKENESLPLFVFGGVIRYYVPCTMDLGMLREHIPGFEFKTGSDGKLYQHVFSTEREYYTFCNFRRYSWSWAKGYKAQEGYAYGQVYLSGNHLLMSYKTKEEMLHGYLERAVEEMKANIPLPLRALLTTKEAALVFSYLLEDAIRHSGEMNDELLVKTNELVVINAPRVQFK